MNGAAGKTPSSTAAAPEREAAGRTGAGAEPIRNGVVRMLLRLPLFYKILIANAAIVFLVALICARITARVVAADPSASVFHAALFSAAIGAIVAALVIAVVVKLALRPLAQLTDTARRVHAGDLTARTPVSPLADRDLLRLVETFNDMLAGLEESRHRLRVIASRALEAGEAERKRIAHELHDGIAQSLAALILQLRLARGVDSAEIRDRLLSEVADRLAATIDELRGMARDLRPPALDVLGLTAALEALARDVTETTGVRISVKASKIDRLLSREAELVLYRLVQEALSNVVRHADTDSAEIVLNRVGRHIVGTIRDNGRGFRMEDVLATGGGIGLFGMKERASYAGGTVTIQSEPDRGTLVRIELPVVENARYA